MLHVDRLTRNVNSDHLTEIFGNYGKIKKVDIAMDRKVLLLLSELTC